MVFAMTTFIGANSPPKIPPPSLQEKKIFHTSSPSLSAIPCSLVPPPAPTNWSIKSLKRVNLPTRTRGDSMQSKLGNQTHLLPARLAVHCASGASNQTLASNWG